MTSLLRIRLIEAAEHALNERSCFIKIRIEPQFIRLVAEIGYRQTHRLVTWDVVEDDLSGNPLVTAIDQAIEQLKGG